MLLPGDTAVDVFGSYSDAQEMGTEALVQHSAGAGLTGGSEDLKD